MAAKQQSDPFGSFAFVISINGIASGFFQEVSGLSAQIDVQEVQEGGRNNTTRKLVGQGKFPNLVLKRGFCNETLLDALMGFHKKRTRLDGTITLRSAKGDNLASWSFMNGFPVKWDGPQLNVSQNAIAIESLEIAHEGIFSYSTSTVDRQGTVTSTKHGPPPGEISVQKTSKAYTENNVSKGDPTEAVNTAYDGNTGNVNEAVNTEYLGNSGSADNEGGGVISDINAAKAGGPGGGNISQDVAVVNNPGELFKTEGNWDMLTWQAENSAVASGGANITQDVAAQSNPGELFKTEGSWDMLTWQAENSANPSGGANISALNGPKTGEGELFKSEGDWDMLTWQAENSANASGGANISALNGPKDAVNGAAFFSEGEWNMTEYGNAAYLRENAARLSQGGEEDRSVIDKIKDAVKKVGG